MRRSVLLSFLAGFAVVALMVGGVTLVRSVGANASSIDPATSSAIALSSRIDGSAPAHEFTLVDQHGHAVSLRSLRGHPVVLTFLDPHCTDICPITSAEFVQADRLLGSAMNRVTFVGINVNPYAISSADVLAYTRAHQLEGLSNFRFLTGSTTQLANVWKDYGVFVQAPSPSADVVHTSVTYFIDRSGVVRYVAMPNVEHRADGTSYLPQSSIDTWAKGIAEVSKSLQA